MQTTTTDGEGTSTQQSKNTIKVFVYGSLKKGYGNNRLLSNAEFLGERVTSSSYILGDVGFPYMFPRAAFEEDFNERNANLFKPVQGELYAVDEPTLASLDCLEGEGIHYHRIEIAIDTELVYAYLQLSPWAIHDCQACHETEEGYWTWHK
jgi:gamma-glutamylaminecyclotransferase